jgi:hypothetical protein
MIGADFLRVTLGNKEAAEFLAQLFELSQEIDDLEDGEQAPTTAVNATLRAMLVLPENAWYQANAEWYRPLFLTSLLFWEASNEWAKSPRCEDRMFAFVYREILEQIVTMTAYLCGGMDHARLVLRSVHTLCREHESFAEWEKGNESGSRSTIGAELPAESGPDSAGTRRH